MHMKRLLKKLNHVYGFTLIELMVVIAIISLLASVVLASLTKSREATSIAKAALDLRAVQNAVELYHDTNGYYPVTIAPFRRQSYYPAEWDDLGNILLPYLANIPYPNYPQVPFPGAYSGYLYLKHIGPSYIGMNYTDAYTGMRLGCVHVYDGGYWMTFRWAGKRYHATMNDGGIDPGGIEAWGGNVVFNRAPDDSACIYSSP